MNVNCDAPSLNKVLNCKDMSEWVEQLLIIDTGLFSTKEFIP